MSRLINKPISVQSYGGYMPSRFRYREQDYPCKVMESWRDVGEWWKGEAEKVFYRVMAVGGVYELYQDTKSKKWYLYKAYD